MSSNILKPATILVVDDNKDNLKVIVEYLKEENHKILVATSGEIALQRVTRTLPDLILLDVKMPGMNGFEVCEKLKENSQTSSIPVIFVTALAETESIKTGFEMGGVDYITKPVNKIELILRVRNHLETAFLRHNLETEVKNQTEELRKAQNYISNIIDSMPSILIGVDTNGQVTRWNKKAEDVTGILADDANGRALPEVFPLMASEMDKIQESICSRKIKIDTEKTRQTPTGICYEDVTIYPLIANGVEGAVIRVDDVTTKHDLEQQLYQSRKMEAIGTLAGGIAHDFNNLLTVIIGHAELLQTGEHRETFKQDESVSQILAAGKRAGELVKQILSFSRKTEHNLQPLSPHLIVNEALKMLRSSMPTTISIQQNIDSNCGDIIADPISINQIVINLCTNAMQAMKNEQGTLVVSLARQDIAANQITENGVSPGQFVVLNISDTGEGMSEQTIDRIFDPYFTTKDLGRGTGLGLSTVHGIIKELKGFLKVKSEPSKGSTFSVYIPTEKNAISKPEIVGDAVTLQTGDEHILCVDDESVIVTMHKSMLEGLGYTVSIITDSVAALERIRSTPHKFDLIITDQTMPNLTGFEMAKEIMKIRPDLPIILSTGYSSVITKEEAIEVGIKEYLTKPFTIKEVSQKIRKILDEKKH